MTLRETKREFINQYYENDRAYRKARKEDYCRVQFEWTCFMDDLLKSGLITEKQWEKAMF